MKMQMRVKRVDANTLTPELKAAIMELGALANYITDDRNQPMSVEGLELTIMMRMHRIATTGKAAECANGDAGLQHVLDDLCEALQEIVDNQMSASRN